MRNAYSTLVRKLEWKRPLVRPRNRWSIILDRILGVQIGKVWTGFIWLRIGTSGGLW
jgi:hypothetical protein